MQVFLREGMVEAFQSWKVEWTLPGNLLVLEGVVVRACLSFPRERQDRESWTHGIMDLEHRDIGTQPSGSHILSHC